MDNKVVEFKQVQQDGIDFYVSADGKMSGMSMRGLQLFTGLGNSTVIELVQTIESRAGQNKENNENTRFQRLPNSLKALSGKVFVPCWSKTEKCV